MHSYEGAGPMSHGQMMVRPVAPPGMSVEDGEAALARMLRLGSDPGDARGALAGTAMLVLVLGALLTLVLLALGAIA
jgi:hypothetical protein